MIQDIKLRLQAIQRIGAFSRAMKQGISETEAHNLVEQQYPASSSLKAYEAAWRQNGHPPPLPWISALGLIFAILKTYSASNYPLSYIELTGYFFTMNSYMLCISGVFKGTFLIFGLKKRIHVLTLSIVFFIFGIFLSNFQYQ